MSEKKGYIRERFDGTLGDIKRRAKRYVDVFVDVLENADGQSASDFVAEMLSVGYAIGVIAGNCSEVGIEGFNLVLNGMRMSLQGEDRKEEIQFAIWDKFGNLHTSEEGFRLEKGGEA